MPTKKEKREAEESAREGCFGTYADDDDNCDGCPDNEEGECEDRTAEIEGDLAELNDDDEDETEEEAPDDDLEDDPEGEEDDPGDSKDFDPDSVDLTNPETRIDTLANLELDELVAVAKLYKITLSDEAKKDDSELMILIDDYFDNLPDDLEPEPEEEEEKPKPRRRRKKKEVEPDPEPEEDPEEEESKSSRTGKEDLSKDDVEPDDPRDDLEPPENPANSLMKGCDIVTEVMEILLERGSPYLVRYADTDHLTGVRDRLSEIIDFKNKLQASEVKPEEDKPQPRKRKKKVEPEPPEIEPEPEEESEEEEETPDPEYPDIPEYFAEIAASVKAKVFPKDMKGDKISMKIGPTVLAMLVLYKGKWQVLYSKGKLDKLPGTSPFKAHKNYPAIAADHPKAGKLLDYHAKRRIRGMRKPKTA